MNYKSVFSVVKEAEKNAAQKVKASQHRNPPKSPLCHSPCPHPLYPRSTGKLELVILAGPEAETLKNRKHFLLFTYAVGRQGTCRDLPVHGSVLLGVTSRGWWQWLDVVCLKRLFATRRVHQYEWSYRWSVMEVWTLSKIHLKPRIQSRNENEQLKNNIFQHNAFSFE